MPVPPSDPRVKKQPIAGVYLHDLFYEISEEIGYTYDVAGSYIDHLTDLIDLWSQQGFIEIYSETADRSWGRIKDSNSVPGSTPWYTGLYHARLVKNGENDPLVVVVFEEQDEGGKVHHVASIRFMLDHSDMFGEGGEKFSTDKMKQIRRRIDDFIMRAGRPTVV
ncbi:hypothetical protein DBO86_06200 [Pseudomonas indoloxydans]|uniref:Uncharacterized protein n=1 Tax=Ectopseudomonas oleovorans TaxID=301 RepID=A0A2T5PQC0_ECTOL|nr:hypothetical protein [Pseudomonas indoloxydans]PTU79913.1 hypothetical protein DBO86_06200 [Pseudomonas indoloxydans]